MNLDLTQAIKDLDNADVLRLAQTATPPGDYLFATILPETLKYDYQAKTAGMTVRTTMAGLSGMDSPYPETGLIEVSSFSENTAKITNRVRLTEAALREMQQILQRLMLNGQPTVDYIQRTALNFEDKLIIQAHMDAFEWLRGQALVNGTIDWTFNKKRLQVDYGLPTAGKLAARTGTAAYGGSASAFWDDVRAIRRYFRRYGTQGVVMIAHPDTIDEIRYNPANRAVAVSESSDGVTFRRLGTQADTTFSPDTLDNVTLIPYGLEGEVLDPVNPGQTIRLPFMPRGKILAVARGARTRFEVGDGATAPNDIALGYTHLAPTIEGGGTPGRWADIYTPESEPWAIEGRGVSNGLPVLEDVQRLCITSTEMSS